MRMLWNKPFEYAGNGRYVDAHARPHYRSTHEPRTQRRSNIEEIYSGPRKGDRAYLTSDESADDKFAY